MRQYKIPYFFAEDDYWTAKYLWEMQIGWATVEDNRVRDGTGIFAVSGTPSQYTLLESMSDVERVDTPAE